MRKSPNEIMDRIFPQYFSEFFRLIRFLAWESFLDLGRVGGWNAFDRCSLELDHLPREYESRLRSELVYPLCPCHNTQIYDYRGSAYNLVTVLARLDP